MKNSILLPLVLIGGLAGGFVIGRYAGGRSGTAATASQQTQIEASAVPDAPGSMADARSRDAIAASAATGRGAVRGGPAVQALMADFDHRKPIESNLRILQRLMEASPEELGDMVRGMTGRWSSEPGWNEARQAALKRWVEVAPDEALAWAKARRNGVDPHDAGQVFWMLACVDPNRALAEARALSRSPLQRQAMQSVLSSIALTDPQRAIALSGELSGSTKHHAMRSVFEAWASRDPTGAAAGLLALKESAQRTGAMDSVIRYFAEQDPAAALQWVKALPDAGMRQNGLQQFFWNIGHRDPEQALALSADLPKHQQVQIQKQFVGAWMSRDPDAAEAWILSRTNTIEQQQLIKASSGHLGWVDPDRAAAMIGKLAPGSARDSALQELIGVWNWNDPGAARVFADTLPEADQFRLRSTIAESLAWQEPEAAIKYLKDNPLDDPAHQVWANLAGALSDRSSPRAALEWAQGLEDEATRLKALPEIFSRMAVQDPAAAAREVLDLPSGASREDSVSRVGNQWAQNNFDDAMAWARGLNGKDRESALGAVLTQGAPHQPGAAAHQYGDLLAGMPAGEKPADSLVGAAATIAGAYFAEDQEKAAAWVTALPQEDARTAAARAIAEQWSQYDAPSASEWIGTLPVGKARDEAVKSLVNRIAASDPSMAFEWAATVADTTGRSNSMDVVLQSWRKVDPEAARAAVGATRWPDDEKARWLEKLR